MHFHLRELGDQLDQQVWPRVTTYGFVQPAEPAGTSLTSGEEIVDGNGKQGSARGSTNQATGRPRSTGNTAPLVSADFQAQYEGEVGDEIGRAYPGARVWRQGSGFWLLTQSSLLEGLTRRAVFLTGLSYALKNVRAWGFWRDTSSNVLTWIGPRHTNNPDGSICAYEPMDGSWSFGMPLVKLLDMYTFWALRHLHLERLGRWPGHQAIHFQHERMMEMCEQELCSCDSGRRYGQCCAGKDRRANRIAAYLRYHRDFGERRPPDEIVQFVSTPIELPPLEDLLDISVRSPSLTQGAYDFLQNGVTR